MHLWERLCDKPRLSVKIQNFPVSQFGFWHQPVCAAATLRAAHPLRLNFPADPQCLVWGSSCTFWVCSNLEPQTKNVFKPTDFWYIYIFFFLDHLLCDQAEGWGGMYIVSGRAVCLFRNSGGPKLCCCAIERRYWVLCPSTSQSGGGCAGLGSSWPLHLRAEMERRMVQASKTNFAKLL